MKIFLWVAALALVLRIAGVNFGLPQVMHQDEPIVINHALGYSHLDFNPHFFKIPPLLSYLVFISYGLVYGVLHIFRGISVEDFALWFSRDPAFFYVLARLLFGVVLGTASVYVLYRLVEKLFGNASVALWAAAFFACNYLHVRDSHYVYVDIPMLCAMLMVYRELVQYTKANDKREKHLLLAATWGGVATAFKYVAAPVVVPVLLVAVLDKKKKSLPWILGFGALSVAVYLMGNFTSLFDFGFFLQEIREQAAAEASSGLWHHVVYSLRGSFGWPALGIGLIGSLICFIRSRTTRWIWLFPALHYVFIASFSQPYERYALPLVPFLCLGIGYLLALIGRRHHALAVIAGILLLAEPLAKSIYLDQLLLRPDTRTQAQRWVESEVPEDSTVAIDHAFFSPNLAQSSEQMAEKGTLVRSDDPHRDFKIKRLELMDKARQNKKRYRVFYVDPHSVGSPKFLSWSPAIPANATAFKREGVRYLIRYRHPGEPAYFGAEMKDRMRLVKTISPYRSKEKIMTVDVWANAALPFLSTELFSRRSLGPYLEIYEWKNES